MNVEQSTIEMGLRKLDLVGCNVAVHSSLSSFGNVIGGPGTVIRALLRVCRTVLMPSFCEIGRTNPPPDDRPSQNGWDYDSYSFDMSSTTPFDGSLFDEMSEINVTEMGRIAADFLRFSGTVRSKHPSMSWAANGPRSQWYVSDHASNDPNLPLKRLVDQEGSILLLGVGLNRCTAIHLAEEHAGRRSFIRWVLHVDGVVRRAREYGCSEGFIKLEPHLENLASWTTIGNCSSVSYPAASLVKSLVPVIESDPSITLCHRGELCRCRDSARGGPIEAGER